MPSAYLLVSHGSRDQRPQVAMEQLAELLSQLAGSVEMPSNTNSCQTLNLRSNYGSHLASPSTKRQPVIGTAYLELAPLPLHEQIQEFSDRALAAGCNCIQVIPLFLLPGMHVMEDIPAEVALAQTTLGQKLQIDLRPYLGTHSGLSRLLASQMTAISVDIDAWILLAHGSRRPGSKQPIEALASQLGAVPAYWAVSPSLESRLVELVRAGHQQIEIMPYFLFAGGITDAIAQSVEQLQVQFSSVNLHLAAPLGASAELADLIWDLVEK